MTNEENTATSWGEASWNVSSPLFGVSTFLKSCDLPFAFYGSFLEELARGGDVTLANDIDVAVCLSAWNENLSRSQRDQFELTANHQRYIARLAAERKATERMVYTVRENSFLGSTFDLFSIKPFEFSAMVEFTSAKQIVEDASIGVHQIAFGDGKFWSTPAYKDDMANHTLTVMHCPDVRAAKRAILRLKTLTSGRFKGWEPVWPEKFSSLRSMAEKELKEE